MVKNRENVRKRKDTLPLFLMTLPGILKVFLFSYVPMAGIIIAFQEYNPTDMFFSPFNHFANFTYLFRSIDFARILTNTVVMNLLFITVGTVVALVLALLLFEIARTKVSKLAQVSFFIPYFVSYVVVSVIVGAFLDGTGIVTSLIYRLTGERIRFYMEPRYWRWILLIVHIECGPFPVRGFRHRRRGKVPANLCRKPSAAQEHDDRFDAHELCEHFAFGFQSLLLCHAEFLCTV